MLNRLVPLLCVCMSFFVPTYAVINLENTDFGLHNTGNTQKDTKVYYLKNGCYPDISDFVEEDIKNTALDTSFKSHVSGITTKATAKDFTYSVRIEDQPYDKYGNPISLSTVEAAIKWGLSTWSTVCQVSFKKVPWNPSSPANINITFQHHYLGGVCGAVGSWSGSILAFYNYKSCAGYTHIYWGANSIAYTLIHEAGHALGFGDFQMSRWDASCVANYNPNPNFAPMPSPRCGYNNKSYYDLRMSGFGIVPNDVSLPPNYNIFKDLDVAIMDYDANGKAPWRPNRIGFWGRPDDPDKMQPQYLSQYEIDWVANKYGAPEHFYPVITVRLSKDWDGVDYTGGVSAGGDGFVTIKWPEANKRVRGFQPPADVRELAGLSLKSSDSDRKLFYRFFNPNTKAYLVSSQTYIPGWILEEHLGYWLTSQKNVSVKIGTKTRSCPTIPMYRYYKPSIDRYIVSPQNMEDGWDGWQKKLLGYIIDYNSITE